MKNLEAAQLGDNEPITAEDLFVAIRSGNVKKVNICLSDPEPQYSEEFERLLSGAALVQAMQAGFKTIALRLLEDKRLPELMCNAWPLREAIKLGYIEIAGHLIELGSPINEWTPEDGSPLLLCLDRGYVKLASHLVAVGAEINMRDDKGWTPLIWAALTGRSEVVDFLLEAGADIHICNSDGWNAVTGAFVKRHTEIAQKLLDRGAVFGVKYVGAALLSAFSIGHQELFERLVQEGADVNITTTSGDTLLSLAIARGDNGTVELLLKHGADPNAFVKGGLTLLTLAIDRNNYPAALALLRTGASPHLTGNNRFPIHYAAEVGSTDLINAMIERGAAVNQRTTDSEGLTPLMVAAQNRNLTAIQSLISLGADPDIKTKKGGLTALNFTVTSGVRIGKDQCYEFLKSVMKTE